MRIVIIRMRANCCILGVTLLLSGCAAPASDPASAGQAEPALSPAAAALRDRLTSTANGLEIRRWVVADQSTRLVNALASHLDGAAVDSMTADRLRRNGFRFLRVAVDRLESLLADIGGASYDANEWHGQVHVWRSILDRPIDAGGRAVAVDGRVQRHDRGEFRLMLRSWTVQMESGPFVHMELVPKRGANQSRNLKRLLVDAAPIEESFGSVAIDVQLESGYAYILLGEPPQSQWTGIDPLVSGSTDRSTRSVAASSSRKREGPDAVAPPTLGELMLAPEQPGANRAVLVFIPKVAEDLYLPEQAAVRTMRAPLERAGKEG